MPTLKMIEQYYNYNMNAVIDQLNLKRQKYLELERCVRTQDWIKCVVLSIIVTIYIDATNVHQEYVDKDNNDRDLCDWLTKLPEDMIDNTINVYSSRNVRNENRKAARHASKMAT